VWQLQFFSLDFGEIDAEGVDANQSEEDISRGHRQQARHPPEPKREQSCNAQASKLPQEAQEHFRRRAEQRSQ